MPLPLILGIGAAIAGAAGVGTGIHGGVKMKQASDTMKLANEKHKENIARFEKESDATTLSMDNLGKKELEILESFKRFSDIFEKIQNRPHFKSYSNDDFTIPEYTGEKLKEVSVGAGALLGGIGGAAAGTAGGFAAAGATTAAVMALGTASTGTAIASLSGAAAVNATLAALGGGALAAGGGGIALGTTILGAATAGVGLLVGGVIFSITGSKISNKADEAWNQMKKAESEINKICLYLKDLKTVADSYKGSLMRVDKIFKIHLDKLSKIVVLDEKTEWSIFTEREKRITENTALLVGLLYQMCKVQLVLKSSSKDELNQINVNEVNKSLTNANEFLTAKGLEVLA